MEAGDPRLDLNIVPESVTECAWAILPPQGTPIGDL